MFATSSLTSSRRFSPQLRDRLKSPLLALFPRVGSSKWLSYFIDKLNRSLSLKISHLPILQPLSVLFCAVSPIYHIPLEAQIIKWDYFRSSRTSANHRDSIASVLPPYIPIFGYPEITAVLLAMASHEALPFS